SHSGKVLAQAHYDGRAVGKAEKSAVGSYVRLHLPLDEKQLWEPGCGRLYDIKLALCCGDDVDTLQSYAGLREVSLCGFRFTINGKSVFFRTVLDQGFYPDGIYTAPDKESLKNDIELSMSLGFNGARLHQKMFEPLFLYYCDKAGYLVFGEHANWGLDINNNSALVNFLPEWCETLERDFNHPSIIGWCPFNETWKSNAAVHDRILRAVYDETKRLDGTRPVIDASGWRHAVTDIYDVHDYEQNPDKFKASFEHYDGSRDSIEYRFKEEQAYIPNLPLFISEFGGIKWIPTSEQNAADNAWGYGDAPKTEEEFFTRYEGLTAALLDAPNIMGFCYTQLYDVEQEVNGLYTYSREKKFADYSRIIAANTKKAAIED
ncbi:MAG: glycoside hydrolase family 2 TIM barrel-domain containing protein, partial [Acutalibacteraceae bacterium]